MVNVSVLRQIVSDMHAGFPAGIRKFARNNICEKFSLPYSESILKPAAGHHEFFEKYGTDTFFTYYHKVEEQEGNKLINKLKKELNINVEFINKTKTNPCPSQMIEVWAGLIKSKKTGFKLPKVVEFEYLHKRGRAAEFNILTPKKLYLDPLYGTNSTYTMHEIAHKNDLGCRIINFPIALLLKIPGDIVIRRNRSKIVAELGEYAGTNRDEFIAETAQKLIHENKQWSDLDPKIKKLYNLFMGPKLNLKKTP